MQIPSHEALLRNATTLHQWAWGVPIPLSPMLTCRNGEKIGSAEADSQATAGNLASSHPVESFINSTETTLQNFD